jgi:hypothetical protein
MKEVRKAERYEVITGKMYNLKSAVPAQNSVPLTRNCDMIQYLYPDFESAYQN